MATDAATTAGALIAALIAADRTAIAACFTNDARIRALTPPALREREGADEIGELMSSWFSDCEGLELLNQSADSVVDRIHISYRMAGVKQGRGHCIIEQHLYADMVGSHISDLSLVCSGFRPTGLVRRGDCHRDRVGSGVLGDDEVGT